MGGLPQRRGLSRIARSAAVAIGCLALAHCSNKFAGKVDPKYGVASSPRVVDAGDPIPKGGGIYRVGKPYVVAGRTYVPEEDLNYRSEGIASWYGDDFHGRLTANGEIFDMHSISAAHPTLPLPSYVRVTNLVNNKSLVVRVNDRGPFAADRVIDLSNKAAHLLGFRERGLARVQIEYVGRAPLEGSDDRQLLATLRQDGPAPAPSLVRVASARPFLPSSSGEQKPPPPRGENPIAQGQQPVAQGRMSTPDPSEVSEARLAPQPAVGRNVKVETVALPEVGPISQKSGAAPVATFSAPTATLSTPGASPVSAFAPTRYDVPAAFLSGRGLY